MLHYREAVLRSRPVAYIDGAARSGTTERDLTRNGNDATLGSVSAYGASPLLRGTNGTALNFGTSTTAQFPAGLSATLLGNFTIAGWFRIPTFANGPGVWGSSLGSGWTSPVFVQMLSDGTVRYFIGDGGAESMYVSTGKLTAGAVTFLALTMAGTVLSLVVDGKLDSSVSSGQARGSAGASPRLGQRGDGLAGQAGTYGPWAVWARALSVAELAGFNRLGRGELAEQAPRLHRAA